MCAMHALLEIKGLLWAVAAMRHHRPDLTASLQQQVRKPEMKARLHSLHT